MAAPSKTSVEDISNKSDDSKESKTGPTGPPAAKPKPKSASDSSLFAKVGAAANNESSAGLGPEGSDPAIIGQQGYALVQRGIQMMNLAFPEDPGLAVVLADLMSRIQQIVPQLVAGGASSGMGIMNMMGQGQPGAPGMGAPGMPPGMGPGMSPGGPGVLPPGGSPMGPPMPPQGIPPGVMPQGMPPGMPPRIPQ